MKTLVLGLGNLLLGDEGVGVHAARTLVEAGCPAGATVLDVGTAVLDALPAIAEAEAVVVIDAVKADGPPGSVYRFSLAECQRAELIGSMHGFDLARVVALSGRSEPPQVTVIGVEPERITWSLELSPAVAAALPAVLAAVTSSPLLSVIPSEGEGSRWTGGVGERSNRHDSVAVPARPPSPARISPLARLRRARSK